MTVGILWKSGGKDFRVAGRVSNYGGGGGEGGSIVLDKGYSRDEKGKLLRSCPNNLDV